MQEPTCHDLKSWPKFFRPIIAAQRTHELRRNDRDFTVGDHLLLREYDPATGTYTGHEARAEVTSITSNEVPCAVSDDGLHPDFCILSINVLDVHAPEDAPVSTTSQD
jgi:hypothetical protein